jgi:hypothetical protein
MRLLRLARLVAVVCTLGLAGSAAGAPHKILVLPVDGTADAATRARLTARVVKLARMLDGQVATAEATFADTALAVGCDPKSAGCSDQVIATLGVDELVWGTTTKSDGQTKFAVRRATRGLAAREVLITIAPGESMERIDTAMAPLFGPPRPPAEPPASPPSAPAPDAAAPPREEPAAPAPSAPAAPGAPAGVTAEAPRDAGPPRDHRDRNLGIGLTTGGGLTLVLGLALLASYASLQGSIDDHDTDDREDFDELRALEDRAASRAIAGDVLVVAGLAAGSVGVYYLYRNYKRHVVVTPTAMGSGAGLTLTILGAP